MKKYLVLATTVIMLFGFATVATAADETADPTKHVDNPHQNYTLNTSACATCHNTHNAAGPKLLSGSNIYDSCTNCHNGTESVYDVLDGYVYNTAGLLDNQPANAGMFGGGSVTGVKSKHAANLATGINMATINTNGMGAEGSYDSTNPFTCAKCHDPHKKLSDTSGSGAYNARLLKAAPRMVAKEDTKSIIVYQPGSPATLKINASSNTESVLSGSYGFMNVAPQQPKLYTFDGTNYVEVDSANWTFNGTSGVFSPVSPFTFDNTKTYKASFWPKAPQVNITYDNWRAQSTASAALTGAETAHYVVSVNKWCGTCHNDYTLTSTSAAVGDYKQKYRHPVATVDASSLINAAKAGTFVPKVGGTAISGASAIYLPLTNNGVDTNKMTCLTCHFAHGSKAQSPNISSDTVSGFNDTNGAVSNQGKLLRYDNRDTCEACHQK